MPPGKADISPYQKGKLRLLGKLSYALEKMYPERDWADTQAYKKVSVFSDLIQKDRPLVDGGLLVVDVRPAVAITKKKKEGKGKKRAASPLPAKKKQAPAKKTKRVSSLVKQSEKAASRSTSIGITELDTSGEKRAASQEGGEVNQPQSTQGIRVSRGVIHEDEDSASTPPQPDIPFLNPNETAAYEIFESSPSQYLNTFIPDILTTSHPQKSLTPQKARETTISPQAKALEIIHEDWERSVEKVKKRYLSVPMTDNFIEKAACFLMYVAYRGTEYFKIFGLIKAFSEKLWWSRKPYSCSTSASMGSKL